MKTKKMNKMILLNIVMQIKVKWKQQNENYFGPERNG